MHLAPAMESLQLPKRMHGQSVLSLTNLSDQSDILHWMKAMALKLQKETDVSESSQEA